MRTKKKLLLINPPANANVGSQLHLENLGLGYVAAAVRQQLGDTHAVHLWDCSLIDPSAHSIPALLRSLKPDYVGLTLSTMNAEHGARIAARIRQCDPGIRILLGGILPTTLTTEELACFHPDALVRGEGEILTPRVLAAMDAVKGRDKVEVLEFVQDEPLDVDALAWPARDMLPWQLRLHPQTSIAASRGCPYRCSFCSIPQPGGKKVWRPRDIDDVVAEMQAIYQRYHSSHFYFVDDNFLLDTPKSQQRAERFAALVLEKLPDIRFGFMCRSAAVRAPLFKLLKKAGLAGVFLGIESFSQPVLDRYRKQETVEEHLQAIAILNDLGIVINPGFIFFDPWTRTSEINETINVMKRIQFQSLESINSRLTCYVGSHVAECVTETVSEKPKIGIKDYVIEDIEARNMFELCRTLFYSILPGVRDYSDYLNNRYCVGYLLPYFLNSRREALLMKYYRESLANWEKGDAIVISLLQQCANNVHLKIEEVWPRHRCDAEEFWRQGNDASSRFFRLAQIVAVSQMTSGNPSLSRLMALAFTTPHKDFSLDVLFQAEADGKHANAAILAEMMPQYRGSQAEPYFQYLLSQDDDAIAAVAVEAALRTCQPPVLALAQACIEKRRSAGSDALTAKLVQANALLGQGFPEYVLGLAQGGS